MHRLGYERYGAQGGDWGSFVTLQLGRLGPGGRGSVNAASAGFIIGMTALSSAVTDT